MEEITQTGDVSGHVKNGENRVRYNKKKKIYITQCPNCGYELELKSTKKSTTCSNCNSKVDISS